jgi:hypothetical protein
LAQQSPDQVFYADLLEGLGYSQNRQPARQLAARLPLVHLAALVADLAPARRPWRLAALLLLAAGLLPWQAATGLQHSPTFIGELRQEMQDLGGRVGWPEPPPIWRSVQLRPANRPARRLLGLAWLLAPEPDQLPGRLLDLVRQAGSDPQPLLTALTIGRWGGLGDGSGRLIGRERALALLVNVLLPHALARAALTGETALGQAAEGVLARLPAGALERPSRAMLVQLSGLAVGRPTRALEQQGLLHLHHQWCHDRRCASCPIAGLVLNE